ncbi:hypothetical protein [Tenacibaculum xiamenense]|uniref:hypothetical protein n=1 Tax=Tenacibaculum xiamenense TaxID=1261553 RepID=UPI00389353E2
MNTYFEKKTFTNKIPRLSVARYVTQLKNTRNPDGYLIDNRQKKHKSNFHKKSATNLSVNNIVQRRINYGSTSQALNGGHSINSKVGVIQALSNRWPHLNQQRIKDIVNIMEGQGGLWSMAQIHDYFKQLVVKESAVPTSGKGRPPTLFTYTHTASGNEISGYGIPQGPHTLGYSAIKEALYVGHGGRMTLDRFNSQISTPVNWWASVQSELSQSQLGDEELMARLKKAQLSYNNYYNEATLIWGNVSKMNQKQKEHALARIKLLMEHMMQLDPYATYAWANKDSTPNVDGKGENTNINDEKNVDRGGVFKNPDELEGYIAKRRQLV